MSIQSKTLAECENNMAVITVLIKDRKHLVGIDTKVFSIIDCQGAGVLIRVSFRRHLNKGNDEWVLDMLYRVYLNALDVDDIEVRWQDSQY